MTDKEDQEDELIALASIFDNVLKLTEDGDNKGGELSSIPYLPDDFCIKVAKKDKIDGAEKITEFEMHSIKYLPPITLNFVLPENYPSENPPQFILSCKWLNRQQLTVLCKKLDEIWEENKGNVILFMWNSFLQEDVFDTLQLNSPMELARVLSPCKDTDLDLDKRAIQEIASQVQLVPVILDFNKQEKQRQFECSSFLCKVCFCDKAGAHCIRFSDCNHVYCKVCMGDYFRVQIQDGNVKGLECPEDKCESQAHPAQVKDLVEAELYQKYDRLLLQTGLDMMSDITYCPRPHCQSPVLMELDSSMAACPACPFVFCTLCRLGYHGLSPCKMHADGLQKLREEYLNANEATKKFLQKKYGRLTIQLALEESFSNEWLQKHSKKCPSCGCNIQKIDGCNKMTCMKCRCYFCWLCMASLSRGNPYLHYNTSGSPCFNRLFEGVDVDRFMDDEDFDDDEEDDWWI